MIYKREAELIDELLTCVTQLWGEDARITEEVHCHDQAHMDILVRTPDKLIAVEAKLSHWNRLIAQAYLNRYCVDYVYVAVPTNIVTARRLEEAVRFGIGVIEICNGSTQILQEPAQAQPATRIRERILELSSDYDTLERVV